LQREKMAERLVHQSDPFGENLLSIAATNFDDKWLQNNFHRFSLSEQENKMLKDSLTRQNFSGYLNKFDTRILTFNTARQPLYNDDSTGCLDLDTIIERHAEPSDIEALYTSGLGNKTFSYAFRKTIESGENILGYVYVLITANRYKSEALYPELFNQVADPLTDPSSGYAYAVYKRGRLSEHFGTYLFSSNPRKEQIDTATISKHEISGFTELWLKEGTDKQVMIVRNNNSLREFLTLFAYLFCSFLFISFLFDRAALLFNTGFRKKQLISLFQIKIRSQLQFIIIFISIFSFLVISITTITLFISRFNQNNEERLTRSIQFGKHRIARQSGELWQ
jgi:two-component system nitrogen regulation sensor histidine kinase NtrY